jgi:hypothetical protein
MHRTSPSTERVRHATRRRRREKEALVDLYVWSTAHDLFIVQLAARALDRLFRDDPDFQLVLARQTGDDGAHAWATRDRITALSGHDQITKVERSIAGHWERVGDIAIGSWQGFLAWELHYEHHILPKVLVRRRTTQIADLPSKLSPKNASFLMKSSIASRSPNGGCGNTMPPRHRNDRNGLPKSWRRMRPCRKFSIFILRIHGH